jgi:hypothetical protein
LSRHLFLFFFVSVAFLAAAAIIYGGVRPGDVARVFRFEVHADVTSLRDDVRIVREQSRMLRGDLLSLWLDARADIIMLQSDAHFEARRLAKPFVSNGEF